MNRVTLLLIASVISCSVVAQSARQLTATVSPGGNDSTRQATDPNITETRAIGAVIEIDRSANRIIIKTDAGNTVTILLDEQTEYLRVPPGEVSLDKAVRITLSEINPGDKVYARGRVSEDRKSLPAQKMIVMLKADIEKDQERQRNEWGQRGIAGIITALDPKTKEITLEVRGREGIKTIVVTTTDAVRFRRYAPDSVRYGDAKQGSFTELKIGDQLRALGEKSADGFRFAAEQVVSGSFRTVTGTVTAVNVATGEIKISTLGKKQPLTIVVSKDSMLRQVTPQVATMIARAAQASRQGNRDSASGTQPIRNASSPSGDDFQRALERLPSPALAEIKQGDIIAVTSTIGADPSRLTAITLVTGVDAVLAAMQSSEAQRNSPGIDFGMPPGLLDSGIVRP